MKKRIALGFLIVLAAVALQRPGSLMAEDGAAVVARWDAAWAKVNDLKYDCEAHIVKGTNHEDRKYHLWFKKPMNLRSEVIEGNWGGERGSVAVYTGGDKVVGHQGGILAGITLSLGLDDSKTTSIRGARITDLIFNHHLEVIHMYMTGKAKLEMGAGTVDGRPVTTVTLFSDNKDFIAGNGNIAKDVFSYDNALNLPVQWERYEPDGTLAVKVNYRAIQVNTGVDDSAFNPKTHMK